MTERQAAQTSATEYRLRLQGSEEQAREKWGQLRWIAWRLSIPHYKKGTAPMTPQQFHPFPWEGPTEEELQEKAEEYGFTNEEQSAGLNNLFKRLRANEQIR